LDPRLGILWLALILAAMGLHRVVMVAHDIYRNRRSPDARRRDAAVPAPSAVYRRNPETLTQADSGELIVSLPGQVEGLGLNAVAARCWELMDGNATLRQIATAIAEENDAGIGAALAEVRALATRLEKALYALPAYQWSVLHTHTKDLFAGSRDEGVIEIRRDDGVIVHVAAQALAGEGRASRMKPRWRVPYDAVAAFARHVEREAPLSGAVEAFDAGWDHSAAGRLRKAEEAFRRAVSLAPGWANPHYQLGYVHLRARRYKAALEEFTIAEQASPGFYMVREYLDLARKLLEGRLSFEAFHLFERAARAEPGDPDHVIELCLRALDLSPEFPSARVVLGRAYARKKDYERALEELRRALEEAPDPSTLCNALCARGAIFLARGMSDQAVREFEKVIQIDGSATATQAAMAHLASGTSTH